VIDAYAAAMTRGDRSALLAVFPNAPAAVLTALAKNSGPGIGDYTMRFEITRQAFDATSRAHVSVTVFHEFRNSSRPKQPPENLMFELERKGDSWELVDILPR
jgi:hypothetical protein